MSEGAMKSTDRDEVAQALVSRGLGKVMSAPDLELAAEYVTNIGFLGMADVDNFLFFVATAPASASHHLAYAGGLFVHSFNVTKRLLEQTELLGIQWPYRRSPYLVGMCHDICKFDAYEPDPETEGKFRKVRQLMPGHGMKSAAMLAALTGVFDHGQPIMEAEHVAIAFHMGAWSIGRDYSAENLDAAVRKYPLEVIATHTADMLASQYDEIGEIGA